MVIATTECPTLPALDKWVERSADVALGLSFLIGSILKWRGVHLPPVLIVTFAATAIAYAAIALRRRRLPRQSRGT